MDEFPVIIITVISVVVISAVIWLIIQIADRSHFKTYSTFLKKVKNTTRYLVNSSDFQTFNTNFKELNELIFFNQQYELICVYADYIEMIRYTINKQDKIKTPLTMTRLRILFEQMGYTNVLYQRLQFAVSDRRDRNLIDQVYKSVGHRIDPNIFYAYIDEVNQILHQDEDLLTVVNKFTESYLSFLVVRACLPEQGDLVLVGKKTLKNFESFLEHELIHKTFKKDTLDSIKQNLLLLKNFKSRRVFAILESKIAHIVV